MATPRGVAATTHHGPATDPAAPAGKTEVAEAAPATKSAEHVAAEKPVETPAETAPVTRSAEHVAAEVAEASGAARLDTAIVDAVLSQARDAGFTIEPAA